MATTMRPLQDHWWYLERPVWPLLIAALTIIAALAAGVLLAVR